MNIVDKRAGAACRSSGPRRGVRIGRVMMLAVVALGSTMGTQAATEAEASASAASAAVAPPEGEAGTRAHRPPRSPMAGRVQLMTKELGLDTRQQAALKTILEAQRDDVAKVWSDPSTPSAMRVAATQAIGDRTADRIRAMLNEEQRKKYIKPRQHDAPSGDVEKWMKTAQGQERPAKASAAASAVAKGK